MSNQSWVGAGEVACCTLMLGGEGKGGEGKGAEGKGAEGKGAEGKGAEGKGAERDGAEVVPGWCQGLKLGQSVSANMKGVCTS